MTILTFPGMRPCAKARPRVTSNGTFMPQSYRRWKADFSGLALGQWLDMVLDAKGMRIDAREPITGPVSLSITYHTASGAMRPDADNAAGAVMDALNGVTWVDDRQVRRLLVEVVKAAKKDVGITVTIERLGDG